MHVIPPCHCGWLWHNGRSLHYKPACPQARCLQLKIQVCCAAYKDEEGGKLERTSLPPGAHAYVDRGNSEFLTSVEDRRAIKVCAPV